MKRRLLDREEEAQLIAQWRERRETSALDRIMYAYEPMCRRWARRYAVNPQSFDDLVQEARIGLIVALDKFDPSHGARLATYAPFWVQHQLERFKETGETGIRIPRIMRRKLRRYSAHAEDAPADLRALAQSKARDFARVSIDTAPGGENRPDGLEIAEEGDPENVIAERLDTFMRRRAITDMLQGFDARRRRIIEARFLCEEPATLEALGRELGITRERVRQLESNALDTLRRSLSEPPPK